MNDKENNINNENEIKNENNNEIEVVIGDNSELSFSEVEDFVEALKPKTNQTKKSKIIIPVAKKKNDKKDDK